MFKAKWSVDGDTGRRTAGGICGCGGFLHVIQPGDTLYLLGKKYHVTVTAIMNANPCVDIYNLQIGDELCIPRVMPKEEESDAGCIDK